jgi:hypothetical protein
LRPIHNPQPVENSADSHAWHDRQYAISREVAAIVRDQRPSLAPVALLSCMHKKEETP